jgi:hypothetical protein
VEHGATLGDVDRLTREHAIAPHLDLTFASEREEPLHRLVVDAVLGVVEQQIAIAERERVASESIRIGDKSARMVRSAVRSR